MSAGGFQVEPRERKSMRATQVRFVVKSQLLLIMLIRDRLVNTVGREDRSVTKAILARSAKKTV